MGRTLVAPRLKTQSYKFVILVIFLDKLECWLMTNNNCQMFIYIYFCYLSFWRISQSVSSQQQINLIFVIYIFWRISQSVGPKQIIIASRNRNLLLLFKLLENKLECWSPTSSLFWLLKMFIFLLLKLLENKLECWTMANNNFQPS